ncbi:MAG: histone deacetylase [Planctomycetaceae bacterium]|nr:histone deacetylase [Planctomycetaceae bacterium]
MTLLYTSPVFQQHETGAHPERPLRLAAIVERLAQSGLAARCRRVEWSPAASAEIHRVHSPEYVSLLQKYAAAGGGRIEADTVVSEKSFDAAALAAGAVCDAVRRVTAGEDGSALCLVRPPGHHALPAGPMGFCLLGNVAIGARHAVAACGLDRVLIVDWDVHHGNGTQDTFWDDEQVAFLSIHRWPFYPGTGDASETGSGAGLGYTVNLPVKYGTPLTDYHARFDEALARLAAKTRPQLVIVSAGFDAHRDDPIGSLHLETEDFARLTRSVLEVANHYCDGRVVSVLEGGYNPTRLAESVEVHLVELLK